MFEEINRRTASDQATWLEQHTNTQLELFYETALEAYVRNAVVLKAQRQPVPPPPAPPFKLFYILAPEPDNTLMVYVSTELVSDKTVADFMPKYNTDVDAVGGPVGGPIPQQPGHFYQSSDDRTSVGTVYSQLAGLHGGKYVKVQEGFAGLTVYWAKIG